MWKGKGARARTRTRRHTRASCGRHACRTSARAHVWCGVEEAFYRVSSNSLTSDTVVSIFVFLQEMRYESMFARMAELVCVCSRSRSLLRRPSCMQPCTAEVRIKRPVRSALGLLTPLEVPACGRAAACGFTEARGCRVVLCSAVGAAATLALQQ